MALLKRTLPAALAAAVGLFVLAAVLLPMPVIGAIGDYFIDTAVIVAAFALFLGLINLLRVHLRLIRERSKTWPYSIVLLISLFAVLAVGLTATGPSTPAVQWIFTYIQTPIQATLGALLAFFVVTAAYRLLRLRDVASALLLIVTLLVLAGQVTVGLVPVLPEIRAWILDVPALAGVRGILLGVALGTVLTGIRLLLAVERPYSD